MVLDQALASLAMGLLPASSTSVVVATRSSEAVDIGLVTVIQEERTPVRVSRKKDQDHNRC